MALTHKELGERLRAARENTGFSQEEIAKHLRLNRVTIVQIEAGKRPVNSLELSKLAKFYGRSVESFLLDSPPAEASESLPIFLRANNVNSADKHIMTTTVIPLAREYMNLVNILGLSSTQAGPVTYPYSDPKNIMEAVKVGESMGEEERKRLNVGSRPIKSVQEIVDLLEAQGIKVIVRRLGGDISGAFFTSRETGAVIVLKESLPKGRYKFTLCHEYCHVLADRDKGYTISRIGHEKDLIEVRANAFAASFLLPASEVGEALRRLGKGSPAREVREMSSHRGTVKGEARTPASSRAVQLHDIVSLAHYFGTSFDATCYRLKNIGLLSEQKLKDFLARTEEAKQMARELKSEYREENVTEESFTQRFLTLAIEAYRRGEISRSKLYELGELAYKKEEDMDQILAEAHISIKRQAGKDDILYPE